MSTDVNRIKKELKDCNKDTNTSGIMAQLVSDDNYLHWKGEILGPVGTPYEGGKFAIDITLPSDYPFVPPKMKFDTKIWHPNISSESGAICLDILKNEWSPALTVRTALISLQALLSAPEPDDPQDAVVAKMYKDKYSEFETTAKFWTETYGSGLSSMDTKVQQLVDMGFTAEQSQAALEECGGDQNRAIEKLFG